MDRICGSVLEAVGQTPVIRLNRMPLPGSAEILVKFEGLNVGGSIKTRTALNMIEAAEKEGLIGPGTVIVEPTSGNQGIGLALVGAVKGYRTVIIMPDSVSEERRLLIRHYGAEVRLVHDEGDIGACISECVRIAEEMAASDPKVFLPQQFKNRNNTDAHRYHTALEIMDQVARPIHGFCSGIGTGGTLTGIGEVLKLQNPDMGGRARKRRDTRRRNGRHTPPDGDRRRHHTRYTQPEHIRRDLCRSRRGGSSDVEGSREARGPDVRHIKRHERRRRDQAGKKARAGKDGRYDPSRHRREILLDASLRRLRRRSGDSASERALPGGRQTVKI